MDGAATTEKKPHVICIPFPAQSHIKAMLKLAELLHYKGLEISFINTEFIHKRFLESGGAGYLTDLPNFRFKTIPDGVRRSEDGLLPFKDESYFTNGYLDTVIDWISGMEGIRLKDFPTTVRTTNPNNKYLTFTAEAAQRSKKVSHNIIHTFDDLEPSIVKGFSCMFSHLYTVGPLQLLLDRIPEDEKQTKVLRVNDYSLWKEEPESLQWLDSKEPNSVIYVNYGSLAKLSLQELIEFGWGLANSNHYFLWIIRPDLVVGESIVLPPELEDHIKNRGFIASWCSQEKVLNHPSVGGFLTHEGWGSTIESLSAGVPMIRWPYLYDQPTNCRYICKEWEVGLEMERNNVKREHVKWLVQELMGEGGRGIRKKAMEWKVKADIATSPNGSSFLNVDNLVNEITMLSSARK
ncbi:hypothetical protein L2E82_35772 [Cichorium intybus]|uniref:Uncharacterized protein n=1 Tax=Cichorium intybus TaxID=13427 RepID=A0ACB9BPT4_CICIN|nr:hypothetical protein L2E82_35772 [Cichorium intybus]